MRLTNLQPAPHLLLRVARFSYAAGALAALSPAYALTAAQCTALTSLSVPATTITSASVVPAAGTLPEHCRVRGRVDAEINFELGLPTTTWNGKFYHQGGGGFVGSIQGNGAGLARNYASVATDTGHTGAGVIFSF